MCCLSAEGWSCLLSLSPVVSGLSTALLFVKCPFFKTFSSSCSPYLHIIDKCLAQGFFYHSLIIKNVHIWSYMLTISGTDSDVWDSNIRNLLPVFCNIQRIRWAEHVVYLEAKKNSCMILVGMPEGKKLLERPKHWMEDSIKINRIGWCGLKWSGLG
jgi:hypothetical protein